MSQEEVRLLKLLFFGSGGEFLSIVDGAFRKSAVKTQLLSGSLDKSSNVQEWKVTIDWQLLNKYLKKEDS